VRSAIRSADDNRSPVVLESSVPAVRRPRTLRLLFVALAVAVPVPVLTVPGVAVAEEPASSTDTVVGQLVQAWPEYKDHDEAAARGSDGPLSFVRTTTGDSVRVVTSDVDHVPLGATVEVTVGRTITDEAATENGYEKARDVLDTEVLAAPSAAPATTSPAGSVNHPVDVVMVVPAGGTRDSTTLDQVVNAVNGPVADFWSEQTDNAVNFGVGRTQDWIDVSASCSDPYALWDVAARAVGFTRGAGKHLLVYVSSTPSSLHGCSDGLGEVGWDVNSGGLSYVRYASPSIIAHELGHNLSLGHSSLLQCHESINSGECAVTPYLDLYDVMGASWGQLGSLNVVQAHRISAVQTQTMTIGATPESAQTITLEPVSQRGMRGIMLQDGGDGIYWLEYRPPSGRDAWLGTADNRFGLESGVLLRLQREDDDTSLLLDGTPSPKSGWDGDLDTALQLNTPVRLKGWRDAGIFEITVTGTTESAATVQIVPKSAITLAFEASGGAGGPMGAATMTEHVCGTVEGTQYCERSFTNGEIIWTPIVEGGARLIHGPVHTAWKAGGSYSTFGFPTTHTTCGLANDGCRQHFMHSNLYWSTGTGAVAMRGALRTAYLSVGEESGVLGYPTADQVCGTAGRCRQTFQGGTLVTEPAAPTRLVPGDVEDVWAAQGYESGPLGYPTTGLICGLRNGGCGQVFQGGRVYTAPGAGAHALTGAALSAWIQQGAEAGGLRYATGDAVCGLADGGCKQQFEGGAIHWSSTAGTRVVAGAIATTWAANGAESGALGFPTTGLICGLKGGGCGQIFQGGRIYTTPGTGTHALTGAIHDAWIQQRAEAGPLGYPAGDQVCGLAGGACKQAFEGGVLYSDPTTGTRAVAGPLATVYAKTGGEAGALGLPSTGLICGLRSSGCGQVFQTGRIYTTPTTGTHAIAVPVETAWVQTGAEAGPLGYPVTGLICGLTDSGCGQVFQGGRVYTTSTYGTHALRGTIEAAWVRAGAEAGPVGYPSGGQVCGLAGGGCKQEFQGGTFWSHATAGTHRVSGAVATVHVAAGAEGGALGYPTSGLICGLQSSGCGQLFQGGRIYTTPTTGTHALTGAIHAAWIQRGAEAGTLGYPTAARVCGLAGGGCTQAFQGGTIWSHATAGTHPVSGAVATVYSAAGGEGGALGYPTSGLICGLQSSGCGQLFQGGRIYTTPTTGTHALTGAIHAAWIQRGAEAGTLGYPTADQVCGLADGGCKQDFQGGLLSSHPTAGTHPVSAAFGTVWTTAGGEGGALRYPITGLICGLRNSGCGQVFQSGRIYSTPTTGTHALQGDVYPVWLQQGAEADPLGYPTGALVCGLPDGACKQQFQGGVISSHPTLGAHGVSGAIAVRWTDYGGEGGVLGYPTAAASCGLKDGGCSQEFEGGAIYSSPRGAYPVSGTYLAAWRDLGAEAGDLGYPIDTTRLTDGGPSGYARFEHGQITVHVDPDTQQETVTVERY
jgi:uncharacterized protein with LGFP repeats